MKGNIFLCILLFCPVCLFNMALTRANMNKVYEVYVYKCDNIRYYVLLLKHYAAEVAGVIATQTPQYV